MTGATLVLPGVLTPYAAAGLTASVAEPSPRPTPVDGDLQPFEVSPGLAGFIPPFLIALACVLLFLSLTRHLRRVNVRQAEVDAAEATAREEDGTAGEDRTDRPGP